MSNSFLNQPATRLSAKRPPEIWSTVAPILAAATGWTSGAWTVEKTVACAVSAAMPAAQVRLSKVRLLKLVSPP